MECVACDYDDEYDVFTFKTLCVQSVTILDSMEEEYLTENHIQYVCPQCGTVKMEPNAL